ncbi:MAG: hypothetical protein ACE5FU_06610, partial [Nitrospinota bacterium]
MEQSFLGEVNSLSGQIKNSPKKFGFPYSFTSFKLDVLMERRFSKVAKVSFLTGEQECSKVAVYIKKSIPNV